MSGGVGTASTIPLGPVVKVPRGRRKITFNQSQSIVKSIRLQIVYTFNCVQGIEWHGLLTGAVYGWVLGGIKTGYQMIGTGCVGTGGAEGTGSGA